MRAVFTIQRVITHCCHYSTRCPSCSVFASESPFTPASGSCWYDPIRLWVLPCFLAHAPGSPHTLPAPTWNQLCYWIPSVGRILSFSADKHLYILSPCSSHNLIFLPPHLLSQPFIICMSTDSSLSLVASGEKKGVGQGKERPRPTANLGTLFTIYQSKKNFLFHKWPPEHNLYFEKVLPYM